MTIHPLPSAFDRFSSTPATTPSPSNIKIIVPRNSPRNGDVIRWFPSHVSSRVRPVQRSRHRFLPLPVHAFATSLFHARFPFPVHRPIRPQFLQCREKVHRQPSGIGGAQRGGFLNHRPHYFAIENIGLKLHQQLISHHPAVHPQRSQRNMRVFFHRFHYFARLKRCSFQNRARQVPFVGVSCKPRDHAPRILFPMRRIQTRKRWHKINVSVIFHRARQRLHARTL